MNNASLNESRDDGSGRKSTVIKCYETNGALLCEFLVNASLQHVPFYF